MRPYYSCFFPCFLLLWLQASAITTQADPLPQETITISSQLFVVNPIRVVLNSTTVSSGGSSIEVDGEIVSADSHNDLFVNGVEVITVFSDISLGILVVPTYTQGFNHFTSNSINTRSTQSLFSIGRASSESPRYGNLTSNLYISYTIKSGNSSISASNYNSNPSLTSDISPASSAYTIDGVTWIGNLSVGLTVVIATITPEGPSVVISSHTFALPSSATGGIISVDGQTTKLSPVTTNSSQSSTAGNGGSAVSHIAFTSQTPIVNTIDGIPLTGNPQTAITVAGQIITPAGPAVIVSLHTFSLPALASGPVINVGGVTITLKTVAATIPIS